MTCQVPTAYHEYFAAADQLRDSVLALYRVYRKGVIHDCQVAALFTALQGSPITLKWVRTVTHAPMEITDEDITTVLTELAVAGILYHSGYRTSKKQGSRGVRSSEWRLGDAEFAKARLATLRWL